MSRALKLRDRLRTELVAAHVEVQDDSARHAGHAGAAGGAGHFNVVVVSDRFAGMGRVERHRAVYAAAGDMIPDEIHALSARTYTPEEWQLSLTRRHEGP
jgi:BolA protein